MCAFMVMRLIVQDVAGLWGATFVGGVIVTLSSFGKYLASTRTKRTTTRKMRTTYPRYQAVILPITSNKRNVLSILLTTDGKGHVAIHTRSPLVRPYSTDCNVSKSNGATFMRVTTVDKLPLIPTSGEGPVGAAAFKANRLVHSTLRQKYLHFIVKLKKDTAGSTNLKVLRTLKFHFFSGRKRRIKDVRGNVTLYNTLLSTVDSVSDSSTRPTLGGAYFATTYSMHGPFFNPGKTTRVFTPRGKTSTSVMGRLSITVRRLSSIVFRAANGSMSLRPNTNTTNNVNNDLRTFLSTRLGPNVRLLLRALSFTRGVGSTSLVVAKRKGSSQRALVKGMPSNVLRRTEERRVPIVLLTKTVRSTKVLGTTKFQNMFSVAPSPTSLRRTVRPRFTRRGVQEAIRRVYQVFFWLPLAPLACQ